MHHVVGPIGDPDHRQPGGVPDDELDVVGVGSATALVDDDYRLGKFLDADLEVAVRGLPDTRTRDDDLYRSFDARSSSHGNNGGLGE